MIGPKPRSAPPVAPQIRALAALVFARKTLLRRGNPPLAIRLWIGYVSNRPNWTDGRTGPTSSLMGIKD